MLWATFFAEYWAVCERKLAVRWGSHGSSGLSKQTTETSAPRSWREDFGKLPRLFASVAVLLGFMCVLVVIAVVMFLLEAFLAILYKGPGSHLAVSADLPMLNGRVDVIDTAYRPTNNICHECWHCIGNLSVRCNPQHTVRTTQQSLQLHIFSDHQTMGAVNNPLVFRCRPFRVHLHAIWPRGSWDVPPSTLRI